MTGALLDLVWPGGYPRDCQRMADRQYVAALDYGGTRIVAGYLVNVKLRKAVSIEAASVPNA